jgi:hypothetical protein
MRYPTTTPYISACLLATYLSACTSWKVQTVAPEQTFSDSLYVKKGVRVTTLDSQHVEIRHPKLTRDTVTGWSRNGAMVAVPLQNIGQLAVKRPDSGRTVLLVAGSVVGAGALTYAALCIAFCGLDD